MISFLLFIGSLTKKMMQKISIMVLALVVIVFLVVFVVKNIDFNLSSENEKKIIYKYNVEDFPYNYISSYYNYKTSNFEISLSLIAGNCYFTSKQTNSEIIIRKQGSCNHNISGNNIELNSNLHVMSYYSDIPNSDFITDTYENFTVKGTIDNNNKYITLSIEDKQYKLINSTYEKLKDNYVEVLYDEETEMTYDLNGDNINKQSLIEALGEEEAEKYLKIDLSEYEIRDAYSLDD